MTYKEAAEQALACQDACNLSGVVRTFAEATSAVWDEARRIGEGTEWVNTNPICTLFIEKIHSLNDCRQAYPFAWDEVKKIAES